jgi:hypothetical protein
VKDILKVSPRAILVWLIVSIASFAMAFMFPILGASGYLGALIYTTNLSATILLHGIPFSLGAVLFFGTETSRNVLSRSIDEGRRPILVFAVRLLVLLIMAFALFSGLIFISFVMAAQAFPNLNFTVILWDFPVTLLSGLVISWILVSICTLGTLLIDDWRGAIVFNTAVFILPGFFFGPSPHSPGVYGSKSLFSFYHLYRFLTVLLSRHEFVTDTHMSTTMSLVVYFGDLMLPLGVLIGISLAAAAGGLYVFRQDVQRWRSEAADAFADDEDRDETSKVHGVVQSLKTMRKRLRQQRQGAVIGLVLLWLVIPLAGMLAIPAEVEPQEEVIYSSPEDGFIIQLGEWLCGQVELPEPPSGRQNAYKLTITIINWGSCPEPLNARFGLVKYPLEDFLEMSEEGKINLFSGYAMLIDREHPDTGGGLTFIGDSYGNFTWAVQYFREDSNSTDCTLTVTVEIILKQPYE